MSYERVIRIWKGLDLRYAGGKALEENFAVRTRSETFVLGARGFNLFRVSVQGICRVFGQGIGGYLFRVLTGYLFRVSAGICSGY